MRQRCHDLFSCLRLTLVYDTLAFLSLVKKEECRPVEEKSHVLGNKTKTYGDFCMKESLYGILKGVEALQNYVEPALKASAASWESKNPTKERNHQ